MVLRRLYDEKYIDSGCDPSLFDPADQVDDTLGTYATNYVIGAVGWVFALLFLVARKPTTWACYFFCTGIGYLLAGVAHQWGENADESLKDIVRFAFIPILLVANHLMLDRGLCSLTESKRIKAILLGVDLAVLSLNIAHSVASESLTWLGISLLVSYVVMLALFLYHVVQGEDRCIAATKALAVSILGGSLVLQVALSGACGKDAYKECFKDCPMPDPIHFNHNGLFHSVFAVGLFLQGMVEFRKPTGALTTSKRNGKNAKPDGVADVPSKENAP
jgi:hypothetical protein